MNCPAAFLVGHWREKKEWEKCKKKILESKYTMQVGFTGDIIIWTRQKIDISNTHLVSIANTALPRKPRLIGEEGTLKAKHKAIVSLSFLPAKKDGTLLMESRQ